MTNPPERVNLFFRLSAVAGGLFVITILALLTSAYSDSPSPVRQALNAHGSQIIAGEAAAIVVCGILAMALDRVRILRGLRENQRAQGSSQDAPSADGPADSESSKAQVHEQRR